MQHSRLISKLIWMDKFWFVQLELLFSFVWICNCLSEFQLQIYLKKIDIWGGTTENNKTIEKVGPILIYCASTGK